MAEFEKVIKGIECCLGGSNADACEQCPYEDECAHAVGKSPSLLRRDALSLLKAQEPDKSKYEYHTDHTDCPWYISGEESKCPVTCSQYCDGWNDAMNYIFRNGDGYRPYDRIRKGR